MAKYIIIDLETTGHSYSIGDRIIDIGIVVIENNIITKQYTKLLNPNQEIPPFIANLTGITDKDVENAPLFSDVAKEVLEIVQDGYIVAHNINFDLGFLNEELVNIGFDKLTNPVLDTVELSRILYPQAPGFQLGQLAEYFSLHHENPHRALSDAIVTSELLLLLFEKLEKLPVETIKHLIALEKMFQSNILHLLEKFHTTRRFYDENNFDKINHLAYRKFTNIPMKMNKNLQSFGEILDTIYGEDGQFKINMNGYEERKGQREISETIYDAYQANKHALIEAGTGSGKTLAYLFPSLYQAIHTEKPIVVSTYTTSLQTQIMENEIPLLKKIMPFPFKATLLKGKEHFISLARFARVLSDKVDDNYDIALTKAILLVWVTETTTGDIDELQLSSSGELFFKEISCAKDRNDSSQNVHSFYEKAKQNAEHSEIIITNHALLCNDLLHKHRLLPNYGIAIIDEAHQFERVAAESYGIKLDYLKIQNTMNKLSSFKHISLWPSSLNTSDIELVWSNLIVECKQEIDDLFRSVFQFILNQNDDAAIGDTGKIQLRLTADLKMNQNWQFIIELTNRVLLYFDKLIDTMNTFSLQINKQDELHEIDSLLEELKTLKDDLKYFFVLDNNNNQIKWIEIVANGARNAVYLYSQSLDIANILQENLFTTKNSIILTSATLTMNNSFSYIKQRLGIPKENLILKQIKSPYNFKDQVQLLIPNDFPDIKKDRIEEYIFSTCEAILSLVEITKGKMLVLFTSYEMLKNTYYLLKEMLNLDEYVLIAQGISRGSRSRLAKNFQTFTKAILLGTNSFWEGLDIPGEDLSSVVIVRLPFDPPSKPLSEAQAEEVINRGKNAFYDYSLPNAVIRFKQGFGRLIRSSNDRGIIFVCDARIKKASYGKIFIDSIPETTITYDSTANLMKKAEQWF